MKVGVLSSGALLLVLSGLGVALPQEPTITNTVIPLPTVAPPTGLTSLPISLTVQTSRTRTRMESETGLSTTLTDTLTTPVTTSESTAPTETSSVSLPLTSGTTPRASSQTTSSPATVITSGGASASTSPNAAPMQFGPWKAQGVAVLGAATTVFAAMLFAL
ncbi:hypothetical protein RhiJN_28568 [Ceratobasidium sp. AG-Ba]|nr:hypothetical protein RhiJN_28568 [Ceratobasidium sp. AG-Ba]